MWVTNNESDNVSRIDAATGAVTGTVASGVGPQGIAFDGTNMWVASFGPVGNATKIRVS
jgi:YVTN family beta-propeller protein